MNDSLVSVVLPTYNSSEFLGEALRSVTNQTHENLEVLVVDDASSDGTVELANDHARDDSRVRIVRNDHNLGPVGNFTRCFELASGSFIKFLMADDLLENEAVERLLEPLQQDPSVALSTSRRRRVDRNGVPMADMTATLPIFGESAVLDGRIIGDELLLRCSNVVGEPSTVLFRAASVPAGGVFRYHGFAPRVIADVALWLSLLEVGRAAWLHEPLSSFRWHPGQDQKGRGMSWLGHVEWAQLHYLARRHGYLRDRSERTRSFVKSPALLPFHALVATAALARRVAGRPPVPMGSKA